MKLGIGLGYSPAKLTIPVEDILEAEKLGFDSVWSAESYGSDAVSVAAYVLALIVGKINCIEKIGLLGQ